MDAFDDTIRMLDDDTVTWLEITDNDLLDVVFGDENVVLDESEDEISDGTPIAMEDAWSSQDLARLAIRLARYP